MSHLKRGINDLQTVNPSLSNEWDYTKNDKSPSDYTYGSTYKAWWICSSCGKSWRAKIYSRNNGNGCPKCRYRKSANSCHITRLRGGDNTLQTTHPDLLKEWDFEKNGVLLPNEVTPSSAKKVWWICSKCGASYQSRIAGRTCESKGCPICAGQRVQIGINDLSTVNPSVAAEWDINYNGSLLPTMVTANNSRRVGWICSICGTRWVASISDRNIGTGCPNCNKVYHSSFPEQAIFWYVLRRFPDTINGYRPHWLKGYGEIDLFVPSLGIGIEYDGYRWHRNIAKDTKKGRIIKDNGIQLIRIREPRLNEIEDGSFIITIHEVDKRYKYLDVTIAELASMLRKLYSVNWKTDFCIERDRSEIMAFYLTNRKNSALTVTNPEIAAEWDYVRNGSLIPQQVTAGSEARLYWKCKYCGYVWRTSVAVRTTGHGCPACAGQALVEGLNDFATVHPELLKEWNYKKNGDVLPGKIAHRTGKIVWWHCNKCGNDYQQRIADKSNGIGCPICAGKMIVPGYNDLASDNPSLAKEWDYDKNGDLTPDHVAPQSNKKVWWRCNNCGHSWNAAIYSRNGGKRGCPVCHNKLK